MTNSDICCFEYDSLVDDPKCRDCPNRLHWLNTAQRCYDCGAVGDETHEPQCPEAAVMVKP